MKLNALTEARYLISSGFKIATICVLFTPQASHADDSISCVFPFWFGFAPVFVAEAEGYFEEEDLTVTTAFDNDRANVLPAMASGSVDCTMRTIGESMSRPRSADTTGTIIGTHLIDPCTNDSGVCSITYRFNYRLQGHLPG